MALKKTLTIGSLFAIFASGGFAIIADAQESRLSTPTATFDHRGIEQPGETGPLVTPGVFNYDAQAFAPFEFTNDDQPEPNTGFFFTIDKTYTSISRPSRDDTSLTTVPVGNDWVWGERYSLGFATDADKGWVASYWRTDGMFFSRFELDADLDDDINTNTFDVQPFSLSNQIHLGELNRFFRQSLKNGDSFEPYLGARYTGIIDDTVETLALGVTNLTDADGDGVIDAGTGVGTISARSRQRVTNTALGFQLGGRHIRRRGRYTFTTDGAMGASYNDQKYLVSDFYLFDAAAGSFNIIEQTFRDTSFIPSLDLEAGVSYNVTRDITVRLGANMTYLWDGVGRANSATGGSNPNSSFNSVIVTQNDGTFTLTTADGFDDGGDFNINSFIATGLTFGVEWKR